MDIKKELKDMPGCCGVVCVVAAAILAICIGCSTGMQTYREGTMTQIGAYVPVESSLYGIEIMNYMNGCRVSSATNLPFEVERDYAATNSYFFGMVKTEEKTRTKVKVGK